MPGHHGEETLDYIGNAVGNVTESITNKLDETIGQTEYGKRWKRGVFNITKGVSAHLEYAAEEANYSPQTPTDALYWAVGNFNKSREEAIQKAGELAANTKINGKGIDPRIGRFVAGEAVDFVLTAGVGGLAKKAVKGIDKIPPPKSGLIPISSGGHVRLDTKNWINQQKGGNVLNLTIKNPDNLARGAAKGWAEGPEFGGAMTKWRNRRMELREQMRNPSGLTEHRRQKNKDKSLITAYNDVSTGPTRLVDNPDAYDKKLFKQQSTVDGRNMEQHHLFPKQESYQFVERMLELGDEDDVLNLMIFAEEVDASMGGRLTNMLNMDRQPHTILHNSRKAIEDGRQLKSLEMKNLVGNAKSSDELMELFKTYLETNIKPSKDEAASLQNIYETAKKQKKHEEMYNALKNKGR